MNAGSRADNVRLQLYRLQATTLEPSDIVVWVDGLTDLNILTNDTYNADLVKQQLPNVIKHYAETIVEARQYVNNKGAKFYHFVQPQIWSKPLSQYETSAIQALGFTEIEYVYSTAWGQMVASTLKVDPQTIDLTHVVDDLRYSGVEIYLDHVHMTERGNEVIAQAIFNSLTPSTG